MTERSEDFGVNREGSTARTEAPEGECGPPAKRPEPPPPPDSEVILSKKGEKAYRKRETGTSEGEFAPPETPQKAHHFWIIKVQRRSRMGGWGFSRGGHRSEDTIGRSWYLFLPFLIVSLTVEEPRWPRRRAAQTRYVYPEDFGAMADSESAK